MGDSYITIMGTKKEVPYALERNVNYGSKDTGYSPKKN